MLATMYKNFFPGLYNVAHVYESKNQYEFLLCSTGKASKCPKCGTESRRQHGHKERIVQDLPILGKRVRLNIRQYKYFCDNEECYVKIFTEANDLIEPYGQYTKRCQEYMLKVAVQVSCESASKILIYQGISVSGDKLLQMLKAAGTRYKEEPVTKIGVDDWAYRKGQKYGTLICDLETHKIIEVLEGRDGEAIEKWLRGHPGIDTVSRDRANAYSNAVTKALPDAVQIADRFHITQNLLEALKETMRTYMPEIITVPNDEPVESVKIAAQHSIKKTRKLSSGRNTK